MAKHEILGLVVKQAREEKNWSQQELADQLGLTVKSIQELEAGNGNPEYTTLAEYFFLLKICPDVPFYEDKADEALKVDRLYRELLSLTPERYEKLIKSVDHMRRWRKNNPDVVTIEDYWNAVTATNSEF